MSVDPLTKSYPMLTPYQFASNTPIAAIDLDGLESLVVTNYNWDQSGGTTKLDVTKSYDNDWNGTRYRDSYTFRGTKYTESGEERNGSAMMKMQKNNPFYFAALRLYHKDQQRKFNRITGDVAIVVGGVVVTALSYGTLTGPYTETGAMVTGGIGLVEFSTGVMSTIGGVMKVYFDNKGDFTKSDLIPTSGLGVLGLALDKGFKTNQFQTILEIANSAILFGASLPDVTKLGAADKALSLTNFITTLYKEAGLDITKEKAEEYGNLIDSIMKEYETIKSNNK